MSVSKIRKLDDEQAATFDTEYVNGERWNTVRELIARQFPDGQFSFLDVGGGNGKFADRLLAEFPLSIGTVLDNSEELLSRNIPNDRKTIVCDTVENLGGVATRYDLVCVHWLLHHLVSNTRRQSVENQRATLLGIRKLLTSRGRVSVFENMYQGWLTPSLPGRLIYFATSSVLIAKLVRALGANTAGVGVCFRSRSEWERAILTAGYRIESYREPDNWVWPLKLLWKVVLNIRYVRVGHFWLS